MPWYSHGALTPLVEIPPTLKLSSRDWVINPMLRLYYLNLSLGGLFEEITRLYLRVALICPRSP